MVDDFGAVGSIAGDAIVGAALCDPSVVPRIACVHQPCRSKVSHVVRELLMKNRRVIHEGDGKDLLAASYDFLPPHLDRLVNFSAVLE